MSDMLLIAQVNWTSPALHGTKEVQSLSTSKAPTISCINSINITKESQLLSACKAPTISCINDINITLAVTEQSRSSQELQVLGIQQPYEICSGSNAGVQDLLPIIV